MDLGSHDIAVIGMAGRFPGASSVGEFWRNLEQGRGAIEQYSLAAVAAAGEAPAVMSSPDYVAAGAPLANIEDFDAEFFGVSALDASLLDPQHRVFLEVCWEALEDAGYAGDRVPGPVGVFGGAGQQAYFTEHVLRNRQLVESLGDFYLRHTGNDKDFLCSRVSFALNLTGPSLTVQTACSTSLVAVHLAVQSLLAGECALALAGGVSIVLPHRRGYRVREGGVVANDGVCRAFSAKGSGTVFGSGGGAVLLRRLADAVADGDTIRAVVRGSAINNDGAAKVSYFAPSVDAQAACVAEAIAVAGVSAESISYLEAHGTGTNLGDPVEIEALTHAFRASTPRRGFCAIGSVKPSIGHLDTAAGVASLIKTVLALEHRTIPASLHAEPLNPLCDFAATPFVVATRARPWDTGPLPRRAGVNSLGIGGTNAHVVLEEAPRAPARPAGCTPALICLSARSVSALTAMTMRLSEHLAGEGAGLSLADVAFTLQQGRRAFPWRATVTAGTTAEASARLRRASAATTPAPSTSPPVVFLFGGTGCEYHGAGRGVPDALPEYAAHHAAVIRALDTAAGGPIGRNDGPTGADIDDPLEAVAALFALEYAMAAALQTCGVTPTAVIGHSSGEIVAATLAGVFSLDAAARLIVARGRVLRDATGGGMLVVSAPVEQARAELSGAVGVAAVNGDAVCVLSGPRGELGIVADRLHRRGIEHKSLPIGSAAHSALLEPRLATYEAAVRGEALAPPAIPLMSTVTGRWLTEAEATDPGYWVRQLRHTVDYRAAARALRPHVAGGIVIEFGAGRSLAGQLAAHAAAVGARAVVSPLRRATDGRDDAEVVLDALGTMWSAGLALDWSPLHSHERRRRVPLPTYAFQRRRCWIDPPAASAADPGDEGERLAVAHWYSQPVWREAPPPPRRSIGTWLVVGADGAPPPEVLAALGGASALVLGGPDYQALGSGRFQVRLDAADSWRQLLQALERHHGLPDRVVYTWGLQRADAADDELGDLDREIALALLGPTSLAAAWASMDAERPLHLALLSAGRHRVGGPWSMRPARALSLGPALVVPRELPDARCVDIDWWPDDVASASLLHRELGGAWREPVVALRHGERFVPDHLAWRRPLDASPIVRAGGVYLITGGLGHIASVAATALARLGAGTIVLMSRRGPAAPQPRFTEITAAGAAVEVVACDVADRDAVQRVVDEIRSRHGAVHGVVHAAGILDDAPLQMKTREDIARVLAPKVRGALVLDAVLAPHPLDFFVVCSSTSAVEGLPGQIDYAAANAFLNAFAHSRHRPGTRPYAAIDWGPWTGGMSAVALARTEAGEARDAPLAAGAHPLLGAAAAAPGDETVFTATYDARRLWALSEHRVVDGAPVLPATAYFELCRAASGIDGPLCIRQLDFLAPLVVPDGERSTVRTVVRRRGDTGQLVVESLHDRRWTTHARADFEPLPTEGSVVDLRGLRERCPTVVAGATGTQIAHVRFGPRWDVLTALRVGDGEAIGDCVLDDAFVGDLSAWPLHPAVLDVAAHIGLALIPGLDPAAQFFVPVSVGCARCFGALPRQVVSHVRLAEISAASGMAVFDVRVVGPDGRRLVDLDGFVVKGVTPAERRRILAPTRLGDDTLGRRLARRVSFGIQPDEGQAAFTRVLTSEAPPVLVITPFALAAPVVATESVSADHALASAVSTPAETDVDGIERALAAWWGELLGGPPPGRHDDFFALGGHSLMALRLFNRIRRIFGVDLGLAALVQSSTIATLAARVRGAMPGDGTAAAQTEVRESPDLVEFRATGSRPPLFLLAGVGGNVVGFRGLADALPADLPVYGLQSVGLDGRREPLADVPSMAAHFITVIRRVQPHGPYHLMGFSAGGLIAYEMAQQLRYAGDAVAFLGALDSKLEHEPLPPMNAARRLACRTRFHVRRVFYHVVHAGPGVRRMWSHLRRAGVVLTGRTANEPHADHRMPAAFNRVLAATRAAVRAYRPQPYGDEVFWFRAEDRGLPGVYSSDENWRWLAGRGLRVVAVPGDHLSLLIEPNLGELASRLTDALTEARTRPAIQVVEATNDGCRPLAHLDGALAAKQSVARAR